MKPHQPRILFFCSWEDELLERRTTLLIFPPTPLLPNVTCFIFLHFSLRGARVPQSWCFLLYFCSWGSPRRRARRSWWRRRTGSPMRSKSADNVDDKLAATYTCTEIWGTRIFWKWICMIEFQIILVLFLLNEEDGGDWCGWGRGIWQLIWMLMRIEDDDVRLWRMKIGLVKQKTMTITMTFGHSCKKWKM